MRRSTGKRCSKRIASGTSTAFRFSSALLKNRSARRPGRAELEGRSRHGVLGEDAAGPPHCLFAIATLTFDHLFLRPASVTEKVCPPIVMVALREPLLSFAAA
jgi:hypothetical protein